MKPKRPRLEPPRGVRTSGSTLFGASQARRGSDEPRRCSLDVRLTLTTTVHLRLVVFGYRFGAPRFRLVLKGLDSVIPAKLKNGWQKPVNNRCHLSHKAGTRTHLCVANDDPDNVWHESKKLVNNIFHCFK
ncbi:hypothetical protein Acr_24g0007290 [Actinidia rufa]|uniref:Uncharacterized protein n=1 Tax=Actinidia rufa TaxID=165716 RepID=A0A7J0GUN0_9ERIC|nr:hypothetical protein Acr_24g0007290 [Actinidia rufa]